MGDSNSFVFRGAAAELRWAYHKAADLTGWELKENRLTATVVNYDEFKVSQRPLTFVVTRPSTTWKWTVESLQITGSSGALAAFTGVASSQSVPIAGPMLTTIPPTLKLRSVSWSNFTCAR